MLKCFNQLGICLGKKGTYGTIDMVIKSFDRDVLQWKEDFEVRIHNIIMTLVLETFKLSHWRHLPQQNIHDQRYSQNAVKYFPYIPSARSIKFIMSFN